MDVDVTTLAVAAIGLAGTLTSPLLAQRIASLNKRQEFEFQDRQQREARETTRQQAALELNRSIYANLNTAARQYQQELDEYIRLLNENSTNADTQAGLAEARRKFRDLYSDAQMIVPDPVLEAAVEVSAALGEAYGMARRLELGKPRTSKESGTETLELAREQAHVTVYNRIVSMRRLMREDLEVSGPSASGG
jgi:hypothetical protein